MSRSIENINVQILLDILYQMMRIREVEETIAKRYHEQKMRCPTHLSTGQECVPSVLSKLINKNDFAVSSHRGHAHYLAKGGSLKKMIAELYGKETGCSGGRGGSMHLCDVSAGFVGTTAIVANSIPLGVGLALSSQLKKKKNISCIYLGDGAVEEGVFYESINFSIIRNLSNLFVCENNLYSVYSPMQVRQPKNRSISEMVKGMGMKALTGDGNNPIETYLLLNEAIKEIRKGRGPFFIELFTYRNREHCGPNYDDELNYRSKMEVSKWKKKDPITFTEKKILKFDRNLSKKIQFFRLKIKKEVEQAFIFAEQSRFPKKSDAFNNLYAK